MEAFAQAAIFPSRKQAKFLRYISLKFKVQTENFRFWLEEAKIRNIDLGINRPSKPHPNLRGGEAKFYGLGLPEVKELSFPHPLQISSLCLNIFMKVYPRI